MFNNMKWTFKQTILLNSMPDSMFKIHAKQLYIKHVLLQHTLILYKEFWMNHIMWHVQNETLLWESDLPNMVIKF